MKEKIDNFFKIRQELIKELKDWVKDKSIPLEERWDVFIKSKLYDKSVWSHDWGYRDLIDDYKEETFAERYEIIAAKDIVDLFLEDGKYLDIIDDFKEAVLKSFIGEFRFDW